MGIQPILSIFLYVAATLLLAANLFNKLDKIKGKDIIIFFLGLSASIIHAYILHESIFLHIGFDLGFFNAVSIIGWLVALIVLLISIYQPIQQLLLILYPIAAIALLSEQFFSRQRLFDQYLSMGLRIHIILSICAEI